MVRSIIGIFFLFTLAFAQNSDMLKQAIDLFENQNYKQAEKLFLKLHDEDKNNAEALYYLSIFELRRNDYDEAIDYLKEAIDINENDYRYRERLGDAYGMKAQNAGIFKAMFSVPKMRSAWKKAVELKPDIISAREKLFSYYLIAPGIAGGDEEKALQLANEVKKLDSIRGGILMARYYQEQEKIDKAENEYLNAAKQDSKNAQLMNTIGYFYLGVEKINKARPWFDSYIELRPDEANPYDSKGDFYLKKEVYDSALIMFETALEKNPDFQSSRFNRAQSLFKLNREEEAKKECEYIIKKYPDSRYGKRAEKLLDKID
ncbi:MAG: tetratricopeptide repeat protein [Calditrichales bacterium]|nr:tetratricopeptide repeat protein [Calditrichales bacterium]